MSWEGDALVYCIIVYLRVSHAYNIFVFIRVINEHRGLVDRAYVAKQIVEKFN